MSKGHAPRIARVENQATQEIDIVAGRYASDPKFTGGVVENYVAEVYGAFDGRPVPLTRDQLVSLRDQLDAWLEANPA